MTDNIIYVDNYDTYKSLGPRNLLINNIFYKEFILIHLRAKTISKWINARNISKNLTYIKNNNIIHIFLYNILLVSNNDAREVSSDTIDVIFNNIKKIYIDNTILLPFNLLIHIIDLSLNTISSINTLLESVNSNIFDVYFKIKDHTILFYIKYIQVLKCSIDDIENNIPTLVNIYNEEFKKEKVVLIIKSKYFTHESSVYELQKIFIENGYWLNVLISRDINDDIDTIYDSYKYIIVDDPRIININKIQKSNNLKIIIIPTSYSHDTNMFFNRCEDIKKYKQNPCKSNRIIKAVRPLDRIESIISTGYIHKYISADYKLSYLNCNLPKEIIGVLKPDNSINNKGFLSKQDFFKIMNLDITKQTITIFLVWPVIDSDSILNKEIIKGNDNHKIFRPQFLNFEYKLYYKNSILFNIINILQKKYNVLIKLHPNNIKMVDNKMYINIDKNNNPKSRMNDTLNNVYNNNGWGIQNIVEKYNNIIIDYIYHEETLNYTDAGIIFYPSTVSWYSGIYNFPMLNISTKGDNDWLHYINNTSLLISQKVQRYKDWRDINKLNIDHNKIFNLLDVTFGKSIYIEDITSNMDSTFNLIISNLLKTKYKYKTNLDSPLYLPSDMNAIGHKLIDIIKTQYIQIKKSIVIDIEPERR
jgi:hypothetical protein